MLIAAWRVAGPGAPFPGRKADSPVSGNRSGFRSCLLASPANQANADFKIPEMEKSRIRMPIDRSIHAVKRVSFVKKIDPELSYFPDWPCGA
ncbi:hypothetical protein [Burkholderia pyrrocinia]|uniref:hypothetical protein n=1 Tax=Burkholderia pyrrocinia TaxID=60550 RepID=UPI002AAFF59F|nr:hypothetical protein [Burkholderia pyrrocinia]